MRHLLPEGIAVEQNAEKHKTNDLDHSELVSSLPLDLVFPDWEVLASSEYGLGALVRVCTYP